MKRAIPLALTLLLGAAGLAFAVPALRRASLPYNERGRFYDAAAGVVYKDGAPIAYGLLAALFLVAAALSAFWARRTWRR